MSPMECDAILTTFMECLQYFSFHTLENRTEGLAILEKVLCDYVSKYIFIFKCALP